MYEGDNVGAKDGADEGDTVGTKVGTPALYVGTSVGDIVGA